MNKISVVINTYNASATLEAVLKTIRCFDEIIVCDMESTDNTVEVAKLYNCKVVNFPKNGYTCCEPARNFAIHEASNEWVLVVDADELVPQALKDFLYDKISEPDCPDALYIPRKNFMLNVFLKSSYPDYQLRFFRKDKTYWPETIHSVPIVSGEIKYVPYCVESLALTHMSRPLRVDFELMNNYTENELRKRGKIKVSWLSIIFKPWFYFIKRFIFKGGFRLGIVGYIQAKNAAMYKYMVQSKAYEAKVNKQLIHEINEKH